MSPKIDGLLDDPAWASAPWTSAFADIEGPLQREPRLRTRARMLWDDDYFYVAAVLREPQVWATLTQRDAIIYHDNDFEIFIDPDGDNHQYFELEINALGTVWDLLLTKPYRDGGQAETAWNIEGLLSAVRVDGTLNDPLDTDRSWTVEIAIPWQSLAAEAGRPAPPRAGDIWRVNFSRVQWRTRITAGGYEKILDPDSGQPLPEDNWVWSPQGLVNMHYPEMWGEVLFVAETGGTFAEANEHRNIFVANLLMPMYYLQNLWRQEHGRYAVSLAELGIPAGRLPVWPPSSDNNPTSSDNYPTSALPNGWDLQLAAEADRFTARLVTPEMTATVDESGRLQRNP